MAPSGLEACFRCGRSGPDLAEERSVEAVERDRYYSRTALEAFSRVVLEAGASGEVTVGRLRETLGLSRKFLIPLLEWSDRQGLTVRSGDTRRLRGPHPGTGATA